MKPIEPAAIRRLLVRGTNWVGDAVMSVPALKEIRRIFPRARISLLVRPWVRDVYSAADFVDELLDYDKSAAHRGWAGNRRLITELKRGEFDLALLLQNAFDAAWLAWRARIPLRAGYARDARSFLLTHAVPIAPEIRKVHQGFYYLGILSGLGLIEPKVWERGEGLPVSLPVRDSDRESARRLLLQNGIGTGETIIGLNPGAFYGSAKRWLSDRYASVADSLAVKYGARIIVLGASSDRPVAGEIVAMMRCRPVLLAGETTLGQLMGILGECSLLITNDSGSMHLAAALDVPQVAIFGSSSDIATGPLSARASVVKHPVDCSPCFLRECPIDFRCMKGVSTDDVLAEACRLLDRFGKARG